MSMSLCSAAILQSAVIQQQIWMPDQVGHDRPSADCSGLNSTTLKSTWRWHPVGCLVGEENCWWFFGGCSRIVGCKDGRLQVFIWGSGCFLGIRWIGMAGTARPAFEKQVICVWERWLRNAEFSEYI